MTESDSSDGYWEDHSIILEDFEVSSDSWNSDVSEASLDSGCRSRVAVEPAVVVRWANGDDSQHKCGSSTQHWLFIKTVITFVQTKNFVSKLN